MNDTYDSFIALWITDPAFRTALRRDAGAACAAAGLQISSEQLAVVQQSGVIDATETVLAPRLSRGISSGAGDC